MSSYAIVETGSKQYKVEPESIFLVEKLPLDLGQTEVNLEKVLLTRQEDDVRVGAPYVEGAKVVCEYLGEEKGEKVISFRYRRRKDSKKKIGHRQKYSRLKVKEITLA